MDEWKNPLARDVEIGDPKRFLASLQSPLTHDGCYLDKIPTGFLTWSPSIKGYKPVLDDKGYFSWDPESLPCLNAVREGIKKEGYINKLATLWSQESSRDGKDGSTSYTLDVRSDNLLFFKYLCMWPFKSSFYC